MVQVVKRFKAVDGNLFIEKSDAERHEAWLELRDVIEAWIDTFYFAELTREELRDQIVNDIEIVRKW